MKYYKAIAFCSNPVEGFFRFRNMFQIYPLKSENAPHNKLVKTYPFVLEYCIVNDEQIQLEGDLAAIGPIVSKLTQSANIQNQILNYLSAISNYRFFFPKASVQWFVSIDPKLSEGEMNSQTSKIGLNAYWYPNMQTDAIITKFTEVNFTEIEPKKHPEYFFHIDIDGSEFVAFSQYIKEAFHYYLLLDKDQRKAVDAAVMLINQGIELRETMKSLSFLSFVSSIETMVAFENKDVKVKICGTCNQQIYKIMAKFRDYLLKYVTDNTDTKKEIDKIYALRSKIVHEGMLFLGDGKIDWSDNIEKNSQWYTHLQVMQISRISLMNWILMRGNENKSKK